MVLWMLGYSIKSLFVKHSPERAFGLRKHWLKYVGYPVMNIQVKVEGMPLDEPAIYVANHRSFADPVVICGYLDAYIIAKAEVANYPIISTGAKLTGVIFVKRENKASRNEVRDMMIDTIQKGYNVLVFPEGTVGVQKHTLDFRAGTFHEAAENGVPIVPIAIEFKSEKDLWLIPNFVKLFLNQFSKWKTEAKLSFGPAMRSEDGEKLRSEAQAWVNAKLVEMHEGWTEVDYSKYEGRGPMYKYQ
jgi:lyso-ornithine lipid O-acyltransferase